VHVPAVTAVAMDCDTVHTWVVEVKDTGSPEDADADRVTGSPTGTARFTSCGVKVIVCPLSPVVTRKDCSAFAGA
jgi:hypothetical protein